MPIYLTQFTYTGETWARMVANPEDRRGPISATVESVSGRVIGLWYAFGRADGYLLFEAPDNVAVTSVLTTVAASGSFSRLETAVLLTVDETLEALGKANELTYQAPGR
jgi:uncharacterized protein with GYD domain